MSDLQPRTAICTTRAPTAIGPYSQAVCYGDLLHCSGALPLNPRNESLVTSSLADETTQCLRNLQAICAEAGTDLTRALKLTIYTTHLERFAEINEAYARFFAAAPPARVTVGVDALPKGASVEIDATVALR